MQTHTNQRPATPAPVRGNGGEQPVRFEQPPTAIPVATEKRGHFQRLPHLDVLNTIAEVYGPKTAEIWFDAFRQYALRAAQARAKGKGIETLDQERAAAHKVIEELASGTFSGRDTDANNRIKQHPAFLAALKEHLKRAHPDKADAVTDAVVESTAAAHGDKFIAMLSDEQLAEMTYVPTKRGAKAETENVFTL